MEEIKVLLVDDEEELITTLAERLQLRGLQVQTATEGEAALSIIESNPPGVVLLDVMMPGMGGIEILKRIKALNRTIPVILISGYGSTEQSKDGLNLGAFDYMMKPCDLDSLIGKIKEAVKSKQ